MKRRTYNNMVKTVKAIATKGYDWNTANEMAIKCWDNFERYGDPVEAQLARIVTREQYERETAQGPTGASEKKKKSTTAYYYPFEGTTDRQTIAAQLKTYHALDKPIRFIEAPPLANYHKAMDFLVAHDRGDDDQLAVRYMFLEPNVTNEKIEELAAAAGAACATMMRAKEELPTAESKAAFVTCKDCGSQISRKHIQTSTCPVCGADLRSATQLAKVERLTKEYDAILTEIQVEKEKLAQERGEVRWLVKVECDI